MHFLRITCAAATAAYSLDKCFWRYFPLFVQFGEYKASPLKVPIRFFQASVSIKINQKILVSIQFRIKWIFFVSVVNDSYFRLHSKFIWLCCAMASIIWSLVASSGGRLVFSALVGVGTTGGWTGPVVTGTGAIGLNAVFTCAIVNCVTCKISFFMQNPLPTGTITSDRWNERKSFERPATTVVPVCFSRKIPVTLSIIIDGCKSLKEDFHFIFQRKQWFCWLTVNSVKSIANDCGSCSLFGNSDRNETTGNRPHFNNVVRLSSPSLILIRFRLWGKNLTNLAEKHRREVKTSTIEWKKCLDWMANWKFT